MIVVSSGAIALARRSLGLHAAPPAAGGTAGRGRGRPDPPGAGLERGAVRHGPHRRAVAADARRHRRPPPLPQRARHAEHAAAPRLHPGDQRERHRGDRGNPLRRQRSPRRARRRDDAGRPARAAVRHRRPVHRRSAARPRRRRTSRWCRPSHRRSRRWVASRRPAIRPAACGPSWSAARIATQAGCAMAIAFGHTDHPLAALEAGARCTWFLSPHPRVAPRASAGSPARWRRSAHWWWMPAPHARLPRVVRCCPAGVRAVDGTFQRGDPVVVRGAGRQAAGARPVCLCQRRCGTHCRSSL